MEYYSEYPFLSLIVIAYGLLCLYKILLGLVVLPKYFGMVHAATGKGTSGFGVVVTLATLVLSTPFILIPNLLDEGLAFFQPYTLDELRKQVKIGMGA